MSKSLKDCKDFITKYLCGKDSVVNEVGVLDRKKKREAKKRGAVELKQCHHELVAHELNPELNAHLKALNTYASIFPSDPYTVVLEYKNKGEDRLLISFSSPVTVNQMVQRYKAVKSYYDDASESNKRALYKTLYKTSHGYMMGLLNQYQKELMRDRLRKEDTRQARLLFENICDGTRPRARPKSDDYPPDLEDAIEKFAEWCAASDDWFKPTPELKKVIDQYPIELSLTDSTGPLSKKKIDRTASASFNEKKITMISNGNIPHVEMHGIDRLRAMGVSLKQAINLGLAPLTKYEPATCAGCSAELQALKIEGLYINVTSTAPKNLPQGKDYRISDNILKSENPEVLKSIINSEFVDVLTQKTVEYLKDPKLDSKLQDLFSKFLREKAVLSSLSEKALSEVAKAAAARGSEQEDAAKPAAKSSVQAPAELLNLSSKFLAQKAALSLLSEKALPEVAEAAAARGSEPEDAAKPAAKSSVQAPAALFEGIDTVVRRASAKHPEGAAVPPVAALGGKKTDAKNPRALVSRDITDQLKGLVLEQKINTGADREVGPDATPAATGVAANKENQPGF